MELAQLLLCRRRHSSSTNSRVHYSVYNIVEFKLLLCCMWSSAEISLNEWKWTFFLLRHTRESVVIMPDDETWPEAKKYIQSMPILRKNRAEKCYLNRGKLIWRIEEKWKCFFFLWLGNFFLHRFFLFLPRLSSLWKWKWCHNLWLTF